MIRGRVVPGIALASCLLAVVAIYPLLTEAWVRALVFLVVQGAGLVAVCVGIHIRRPTARHEWLALAASQALWLAGHVLWWGEIVWLGTTPSAFSAANAFYLAGNGSVVVALGLVLMRRGRGGGLVVETIAVAIMAGALAWAALLHRAVHEGPPGDLVVPLAFVTLDVLLVASMARLVAARGIRTIAALTLMAAVAALVVSDVLWNWLVVTGTYVPGHWADLGWLVFPLLVGAAALHPSAAEAFPPLPSGRPSTEWHTLWLLLIAPAGAAATLLFWWRTDGDADTLLVILVSLVAITGLLVVRIAILLGARDTLEHGLQASRDELQRLAEEHERARQRYQGLFDGAPVGYFTLLRDGTIEEVNPAGARQVGGSPVLLAGSAFAGHVDAESIPAFQALVADALAGGSASGELSFARAGGGSPLRVKAEAAVDPVAGTLNLVTVDVTARRRAEQELDLLRERAEETERATLIETLAGGIAHDLNNVLAIILGNAELAAPGADAATGRRLAQISEAAGRGSAIVREILAYARRQILATEEADWGAVLAAAEPLLQAVLGPQIVLSVRPPVHPAPRFSADPGQLVHALESLAANARDAMPDGGAVTVSYGERWIGPADNLQGMHGRVPAGAYAAIEVVDEGVGIDPSVLARVAMPFFTTKRPGRGSGLGLAAVDGIVTQSNGHWLVESTPGAGTKVTILFPAIHEQGASPVGAALPQTAPAPAGRPDEPPPSERAPTVLVVDDEQSLRELCGTALRRAGYDVLLAASGEEALGLLAGSAVDVLVADVVMPGMSGPELIRRARAGLSTLPALSISGYTFDESAGKDVGTADAYLQKPFTLDALVGAVRDLVARAAAGRSS